MTDAPARDPNDPQPAALPTQPGPRGLRYDFNRGARVLLPPVPEGGPAWRVRLRDLDTGNTLFETETRGALVSSSKRWFVRFGVEVWSGEEPVLAHEYSARDREVLIHFYVGTLGDIVAWFPAAARFAERHGCRLTCAMGALLIPLFRAAYPGIAFVTPDQVEPERYYATYKMMFFYGDEAHDWQPCEARQVGLHRTAAYLLGVEPSEQPPRLALPDESRPIPEPYVCIATQATSQAKYWNNPDGWPALVRHLQARGLRVVCIDRERRHGAGLVWNAMPPGAEDQTGDRPLVERARWLRHAAGFVGLSSGLSWLAWAAGCPVVLVSGFTHPTNEFATPYRVINWHACNSCWNDPGLRFDNRDFLWCPRLANTPRQFECTRLITPAQVIAAADRMLNARGLPPAPAPVQDRPPPGRRAEAVQDTDMRDADMQVTGR